MSAAPLSLDPADPAHPAGTQELSRLLFDTLVELDARGMPQPAVAIAWEPEPGQQRWRFNLRPGVTFDDGTPVTAEAVAASLRAANANWTVSATGDAILIVRDSAAPGLPAELALPRNSIAKRGTGRIRGTGPFALAQWEPGKKIVLTAREDYWRGRPFLNAIEIELNQGPREQMIALDLAKLDVIEVAPEQARQAAAEGRRVTNSLPVELVALVFNREQSPEDGRLRQALNLSLDRDALNRVFLHGESEPTAGLLPDWMTGYGFVFSSSVDLDRARQLRTGLRQAAPWSLSYDAADPLLRLIAERIALNARDTGLNIQPGNSGAADLRLARMRLPSLDARTSLSAFAAQFGLALPRVDSDSAQDLYAAESALLQSQRVIPLLHLRAHYCVGANLKHWNAAEDGVWDPADAWLITEKP